MHNVTQLSCRDCKVKLHLWKYGSIFPIFYMNRKTKTFEDWYFSKKLATSSKNTLTIITTTAWKKKYCCNCITAYSETICCYLTVLKRRWCLDWAFKITCEKMLLLFLLRQNPFGEGTRAKMQFYGLRL